MMRVCHPRFRASDAASLATHERRTPLSHITDLLAWLRPRLSYPRLKRLVVGPPRDPLAPETRQRIALVAFLAWVGLGADGLSSANYGPEEAFLALGTHTHLALYLAVATALTVFVIALAYNQVIELFPSGGGGYKVATTLLGPRAGLVSGSALMVDYVLTIAISIASGVDALFSLLPVDWQGWKLMAEIAATAVLLVLNLRGVKEPLKLLVPLFLGFLLTHGFLIVYGIVAHSERLPALLPETFAETGTLIEHSGWIFFASLLLRAFAMGGGTYTGIEAVSNNINLLREPRVPTGQWTMLYMALSLAFVAGGLIVLYLLWNVAPEFGRTLNAVTFDAVLDELMGVENQFADMVLVVVLVFAAALLFVAANTGFLGGPAVLANMAIDRWVPHQFSQLSNRLVTQNGVLLMGAAAAAILVATGGDVSLLVVLYSINVFATFTLCLCGLCRHWWRQRAVPASWRRLAMAATGFTVCAFILMTTIVEKFVDGAWMTLLITGIVVLLCLMTRRHYEATNRLLAKVDALFATATPAAGPATVPPPALDPSGQTAVFLVGRSLGSGMHTLLSARKMFPDQFRNFVFISVGEIEADNFHHEAIVSELTREIEERLGHFVTYCQRRGLAATYAYGFSPDTVEEIIRIADRIRERFPNAVFFASRLIFSNDTLRTRLLHNQTALAVQRRLHLRGAPMVILPMKV